jgi:hypothetical protein
MVKIITLHGIVYYSCVSYTMQINTMYFYKESVRSLSGAVNYIILIYNILEKKNHEKFTSYLQTCMNLL